MAVKMRYGAKAEIKATQERATPCAAGTFTLNTSRTTVEIGFKAKYLTVLVGDNATAVSTYNADLSTTQARYSGSSTSTTRYTMESNTSNYHLHEVTDTGFTVNGRASGVSSDGYYYAVGE